MRCAPGCGPVPSKAPNALYGILFINRSVFGALLPAFTQLLRDSHATLYSTRTDKLGWICTINSGLKNPKPDCAPHGPRESQFVNGEGHIWQTNFTFQRPPSEQMRSRRVWKFHRLHPL